MIGAFVPEMLHLPGADQQIELVKQWLTGRAVIPEIDKVWPRGPPQLDRPLNARGLAAADFDNDGDTDLAISCNRGPLILLRADGAEQRNWIKVSLEGKKSNRQGIGALVRVSAAGRTYLQVVGSQGSYLSQHATPLHFGLGRATAVDRVEVLWPSGRRQSVDHAHIRQRLHLKED